MSLVIDFVLVVGDVYTFYNPYTPERTGIGNKADKTLVRGHPNIIFRGIRINSNSILHEIPTIFQRTLGDYSSIIGVIDGNIGTACYMIGFSTTCDGVSANFGHGKQIAYTTYIGYSIDVAAVSLVNVSDVHNSSLVEIPIVGTAAGQSSFICIITIGNNIAIISINPCNITIFFPTNSHSLRTAVSGQSIRSPP